MGHLRDLHANRTNGSATPRRRTGMRWQARWTDPAGIERSRSFPTRDEARAWLTSVEASIRTGGYQLPTHLTVAVWAEGWLARQDSWRKSTRVQQTSRIRAHLLPALGSYALETVTRRDLETLADRMREAGLSASTRRAVLHVCRALFRAAVAEGHLVRDPAAGVRAPSNGAAREVYQVLTTSQVDLLIAAMPTPNHRLLAELVAATGIRISEARSLTVDRLNLGSPASVMVDRQLVGQATSPAAPIAFGAPKGGRAGVRRIAIPNELADLLAEHVLGQAASEFVFCSSQYAGRPLNPRSLNDIWQTAAKRSGIDSSLHRGWHALRHHHASRLIAAGVTPVAVQRRLGHSSASITLDVYSHLWPTDEQAVLKALNTP